jgi:signal transduction histidine kinase
MDQLLVRLRARFATDLLARTEADRRRTAHDLHDGVGQSLSLLVSGLKTAHAAAAADPALADRCGRLLDLARTALRDVRRVSHGLRPSALDDLGLVPALERLAADTRDHHPLDLTLDAAGLGGGRLAPEVETALFRIAQESLANVVRHAGARAARVALRREGDAVVLEVADDGRGFRPGAAGPGGHLGVAGMRERAALVGGRCEVEAAPGRGTRVRAVVPAGGCEWTDSD